MRVRVQQCARDFLPSAASGHIGALWPRVVCAAPEKTSSLAPEPKFRLQIFAYVSDGRNMHGGYQLKLRDGKADEREWPSPSSRRSVELLLATDSAQAERQEVVGGRGDSLQCQPLLVFLPRQFREQKAKTRLAWLDLRASDGPVPSAREENFHLSPGLPLEKRLVGRQHLH